MILITGAAGFIGRRLALRLADAGETVIGLGHGNWADHEADGVSLWLNGSVSTRNLGVLSDQGIQPSRVFHLAGGSTVGASFVSPLEDFRRTVCSGAELLEWMRCEVPDAKLAVVSSAAVYGAGHHGPIAEDADKCPLAPYGAHKLALEELCASYGRNFGLHSILVRPFSVYGPGLEKQLWWDLCRKLQLTDQITLGGTGEELRDWVHVDDLADWLVQLSGFAVPSAPAFNAGTGVGTPVSTIVRHFLDIHQTGAQAIFSGEVRPGDPVSLIADVTRLRSVVTTNLERSLVDEVSKYVEWFRSRG